MITAYAVCYKNRLGKNKIYMIDLSDTKNKHTKASAELLLEDVEHTTMHDLFIKQVEIRIKGE